MNPMTSRSFATVSNLTLDKSLVTDQTPVHLSPSEDMLGFEMTESHKEEHPVSVGESIGRPIYLVSIYYYLRSISQSLTLLGFFL